MTITATQAQADYPKSPITEPMHKRLRFILLPAMSLVYLSGIVLMLPVLMAHYIGCSFGCLAIAISGKLFPEQTSPKAY